MKVAKKNEVNTIDQATDFNVTGFVFSAFSHFIIENYEKLNMFQYLYINITKACLYKGPVVE